MEDLDHGAFRSLIMLINCILCCRENTIKPSGARTLQAVFWKGRRQCRSRQNLPGKTLALCRLIPKGWPSNLARLSDSGSSRMRSIPRGLPNVYLFINPNSGKPYLTDWLQRLWRDACKTAGASIGLYAATRHSVASMRHPVGCQ